MSAAPKLTTSQFDEEVVGSNGVVLVDFMATWCPPCMALAPTVDALAHEFAGRAKVVTIDTDEETELSDRYGIQSIPTLILFKNGQKVERLVGPPNSKRQLADLLSKHLDA